MILSLSGRTQKWFDKLDDKARKEYLERHPKSKFAKHATGSKTVDPMLAERKIMRKLKASKSVQLYLRLLVDPKARNRSGRLKKLRQDDKIKQYVLAHHALHVLKAKRKEVQ